MRTGTSYFESFRAAVSYYKDYGFSRAQVQDKLQNREIYIGKPEVQKGERLALNEERRYVIITK